MGIQRLGRPQKGSSDLFVRARSPSARRQLAPIDSGEGGLVEADLFVSCCIGMALSPPTAFVVQVMLWLDGMMQCSLALCIIAICFADIPGGLPAFVPFSVKVLYGMSCGGI